MILMFIDDYLHEKLMGKVLIIGDLKKFYTSPYIWISTNNNKRRDGIF
jgi:hypothetical protein